MPTNPINHAYERGWNDGWLSALTRVESIGLNPVLQREIREFTAMPIPPENTGHVIPDTATDAQVEAIERVATSFGCWPHDVRVLDKQFDLPEGYLYGIIGEAKDRPYHFGVSPKGEVSS